MERRTIGRKRHTHKSDRHLVVSQSVSSEFEKVELKKRDRKKKERKRNG